MAAIVTYTLGVAILLAAGARALEELARSIGAPRRFIWLTAMFGTLILAVAAPYRSGLSGLSQPAPVGGSNTELSPIPSPVEADTSERLPGLYDLVQTALQGTLELLVLVAGTVETEVFIAGWVLVSSLLALIGLRTLMRYRAARRVWPAREVDGVPVRISRNAGPAVLGVLRPEIVVPAWFLEAPAHERNLMLLHEGEHLRARDPLMLGVGSFTLVVAPWVLPLWWMHRRLMLAVEVDCDARVLRHGVARRDYGAMLIDVAGRGSNLSAGAAAFSGTSTNLEKRLLAMTTRVRGIGLKGASWGVIGLTVIAAACATELPTSAEIEGMDVAAVENAAQQLMLINPATDNVVYYLDGEQITAEQARTIPASAISAVEVILPTEANGARSIRLSSASTAGGVGDTQAGAPDDAAVRTAVGKPGPVEDVVIRPVDPAGADELEAIHVVGSGSKDSPEAGSIPLIEGSAADGEPGVEVSTEPTLRQQYVSYGVAGTGPPGILFVIDGVHADASAFGSLRPADIESLTVLKDAAAAVYGFGARNGVILVTTRDGANR